MNTWDKFPLEMMIYNDLEISLMGVRNIKGQLTPFFLFQLSIMLEFVLFLYCSNFFFCNHGPCYTGQLVFLTCSSIIL